MKKINLMVAALFAVLIVISGCSKKAEAVAEDSSDNSGSGESRPTIRLITDATGIDDKSFNAAAWRGILDFYGDTWEDQKGRGTLYDVITSQTQDMYIPNLKQAADEGYDIICVTGFTFANALNQVAPLYPDQKFMIVDDSQVVQPNVLQATFAEEQGSYLVGVAAALQAQEEGVENPQFGFIGGIPGPLITKFEMGYIQGLLSVLPEAKVVDYYANDWARPELAKAQAKNWYDSGVYAIFSAAGGTGNGTIAQAKEYRTQGKNIWAIGVDSDQYADGIYEGEQSAVLTSMVKKVESAARYALKAVEAGTFKAEIIAFDMKIDGVGYATSNPALSTEVIQQVDQAREDIISGAVVVVPSYAEALEKGLVPEGLSAKD